jgi:thioredoxin 1
MAERIGARTCKADADVSGRADRTNPRPLHRRSLLAAVLGVAVAAGAASYALIERTAPSASVVADGADADEVQRLLRRGKPTVVEFGANACASCREMKPILDALQRDHGERISVLNIDILKSRGYTTRYRIQLMPTQVYFDAQGREIGRTMGKVSAGEILARLRVVATEQMR